MAVAVGNGSGELGRGSGEWRVGEVGVGVGSAAPPPSGSLARGAARPGLRPVSAAATSVFVSALQTGHMQPLDGKKGNKRSNLLEAPLFWEVRHDHIRAV